MLNEQLLSELFIQDPYAVIVKNGKAVAVRGFLLDVFKNPLGDCSNDGVSNRHTKLFLPCGDGPFKASVDDESVVIFRQHNDHKYLEPLTVPAGAGWMMGGNYAASPDSRFAEHFNQYPLPIHDRQE